jgi:hypothetical protein
MIQAMPGPEAGRPCNPFFLGMQARAIFPPPELRRSWKIGGRQKSIGRRKNDGLRLLPNVLYAFADI